MTSLITTVLVFICLISAFGNVMIQIQAYQLDVNVAYENNINSISSKNFTYNQTGNEDMPLQLEDKKSDMRYVDEKRTSSSYVYRLGCIRRGDVCDYRPNECCFNSSCRCNLWGSNCRCQRMGLFQKWG